MDPQADSLRPPMQAILTYNSTTPIIRHHLQTRQVLASVDLRLQTATQTIAEELVGVRSDLRYGTAQVRQRLRQNWCLRRS